MAAVFKTYELWNTRIPTGELNRWLEALVSRHPPPAAAGRRLRLRYITQAKARPPTFILFTGRPQQVSASYLRYLENGLRDAFGLAGVPLRVILRAGRNPYVEGA
jgi:GTP-binding protein